MFRSEDIRKHLDRRPFEAFRICLSDGQTYEVRHPDLCIVDPNTVYVGKADVRRPGVAMEVHHCALAHIVRFEPVNGGKRGRSRRTAK